MEGEIDLDDLIKRDKQKAVRQKTHPIHKQHSNFKHPTSNRQRFNPPKQDYIGPRHSNPNHPQPRNHPKEQVGYTILVRGFVSDVSSEDILNLCGQKKILSIKTTLKGNDGQPISQKNMDLQVIIAFLQKQDADSFIKQYSDKKLDGKHTLTFQYRRSY